MQRQVRGSSPKLERIAVTVAAMAIVAADRHVHREWAPTTPRLGLMQRTTSVPLNPRSTRGQEPKQAQHLPHRSLSANSVEVGARRGFSSLGDATTRCSRTVPFPLFSIGGTGTTLPRDRSSLCHRAAGRLNRPARSCDSSTSPRPSFLAARQSRSFARVSTVPCGSSPLAINPGDLAPKAMAKINRGLKRGLIRPGRARNRS
jgi:hypothetical protein